MSGRGKKVAGSKSASKSASKNAGSGAPRRKRRKRRVESDCSYIFKVLKQVHPEIGMSNKGMATMESYVADVRGRIMLEANRLVRYNGKTTLGAREIQTAARLVIPGELGKHAISEGTKAVTKFGESEPGKKGVPKSMSARAGLQFPAARRLRMLKKDRNGGRTSAVAGVYLAAVEEYLTAEVLELSGNAARHNKRARIIPRHVELAVRNDEELNNLLKDVTIAGGGVLPHIHAKLKPVKKNKKKQL